MMSQVMPQVQQDLRAGLALMSWMLIYSDTLTCTLAAEALVMPGHVNLIQR